MRLIKLENQTMCLEFNPMNGALVQLTALKRGSESSSWRILARPQLGLSFQLLVPLSEDRRNNPVYGEKQRLSVVELFGKETALDPVLSLRYKEKSILEGISVMKGVTIKKAVFVWDGVVSEVGGFLPIRLELEVRLDEQQAVFTMTVENQSDYIVENVFCPYLGEVRRPPGERWFKSMLFSYASAVEFDLWPRFDNLKGYYGVDYPIQIHPATPMAPFFLMRGEKQGLYVGVGAPSAELVAWQTELRPGYGSSIDSRVPETPTIAGKDVAVRFAAVHLPYIQPGERRTLTPIILQPFWGGWQMGVDIYRNWRKTWMKIPQLPAWAREPHAWQQVHINSPEDELRLSFRELVKIGEDCARHGVKAIQLVGWNDGGQDQGNPSHDPDPRLGTFEELKEAIARIQALGVKVVLFAKYTWADRATERFRQELIHHAVKDPYGDYYHYPGYQYQTATQLLDINTKRLIPMCFLSEGYLRICEEEFKKIVELGADGILYDECQHHSPALLCFDLNHGHRLGAPIYANDRVLIERFRRIVQEVNPDFLFAGEACYDWEMEVYHLAYFRSFHKEHVPLSRYLLPEAQLMTAVTGFNDRNMINQCLLYRYIISYEPYHFKGRLDDFPETVAYGRQMDELRAELREYFWEGEFQHEVGTQVVRANGSRHHPYSVFVSKKSGKKGIAIANYEEKKTIWIRVKDNGEFSYSQYRLVDDPKWRSVNAGIELPPCSAAVVI